jgi:hypothetical protein
MGTRDHGIDAYIARSAEFARPILARIRRVVHAACPEATEALKWGFPHFLYGKRILCSMAAFKAHCSFGFWDLRIETPIKAGSAKEGMGQFGRITSLSDLPTSAALTRMVKNAMKLSAAGTGISASPRKPAKEKPVPTDFLSALKKRTDALAGFKGMSPSHRNEYVEWITEAKTEATRQKRIAAAAGWLAEGKSRNWKYERK